MNNHHLCQICQENFSTEIDFMEHMKSHIEGGLYACMTYPESFSTSDNDKRKHTKGKSKVKKTFSCEVCSKNFPTICRMEKHRLIHTGEKNFECHLCQKRFVHRDHLTVHIRTHTGEKPFECDICKNRFTKRDNLTAHMRTHTGEKPFECDICKNRFSKRDNLTVHIRTHTGEKPYICDVCHKAFNAKNQLVRHMRAHTGERLYACTICKVSFKQRGHLHRHMKSHGPFSCNVCHENFEKKHDLTIHAKTHTNMQQPLEDGVVDIGNAVSTTFNSENSMINKDPSRYISVIPGIVNIDNKSEEVDLKFDPVMIDVSDVKPPLNHYLGKLDTNVKIESVEIKEELL